MEHQEKQCRISIGFSGRERTAAPSEKGSQYLMMHSKEYTNVENNIQTFQIRSLYSTGVRTGTFSYLNFVDSDYMGVRSACSELKLFPDICSAYSELKVFTDVRMFQKSAELEESLHLRSTSESRDFL